MLCFICKTAFKMFTSCVPGHDRFEVTAKKFQVNDVQGNILMNVDKNSMELSAGTLRVEGDGGVIFRLVALKKELYKKIVNTLFFMNTFELVILCKHPF